MLKALKVVLIVSVALAAALGMAVAASSEVQWRAKVLWLHLKGDVPQIRLLQILRWLAPGSPVYLEGIAVEGGAIPGVVNFNSRNPEYIRTGEQLYREKCSNCHGGDGRGGSAGPSLLDAVSNSADWVFFSTVKWGRKGTAMAAQPLGDDEIWRVHAQLANRARAWAAEAAGPGRERRVVDVPPGRLLAAEETPDEWLMYTGNYSGHRHSRLVQITPQNVHRLRPTWVAQLQPSRKPLSATPVVVNGKLFVTEAPDGVVAIDARSGETLWRWRRQLDPSKLSLCCGAFNRGVAVLGDRLFVTTLDAALVALDANTGKKLWEVRVGEPKEGYSMTNAPLALDGQIVLGVAGGEFGMRGFVAAYSPQDGKKLWQWWAIPGPGEPGHDTWNGDSWKTGAASTWMTGVFDPGLDVIYWTVGNPWPPLKLSGREGDNLYSNSVVALERKTGKMLWYYQFTPADAHDWDATQQPILTEIFWKGEKIAALLQANRNGFYYAIDRRNGKVLYAKAFVKQTWNKGFDAKWRPIRDPASLPSIEGTTVWPWMHGGANWWAPSYDPKRHLHIVPTVDAATQYFRIEQDITPGKMTMGGTTLLAANQPGIMAVKAFDPDTGNIKWSARLDRGNFHQFARLCGALSTGGGVTFSGFEGRFVALDSDTGKEVWDFAPGGMCNAAPVTYTLDGVQYVAVIAGNALFAFSLAPTQ